MRQDFSWERPAQAYVDLYRALLADSAVAELHATEQATNEANTGFCGASRYYSPRYRGGFALECCAIRHLREEMGFRNVTVMIPRAAP
jgi:phosphoenolpyruvate synthase/pyruvate phosphate dikinase